MAVNPISSGSPHVRCTPTCALSTCDEPDGIKKDTHPKNITAFFFASRPETRAQNCIIQGSQFTEREIVRGPLTYMRVAEVVDGRLTLEAIDDTFPGDGNRFRYASQAVQLHPDGGQFDFVWLSARTPHEAYV